MSNDTPPFLLESEERKAGPCPRPSVPGPLRLITSQIDTAPKPPFRDAEDSVCLITSQIDTAPKRRLHRQLPARRLITSQIDTAPKRVARVHPRDGV